MEYFNLFPTESTHTRNNWHPGTCVYISQLRKGVLTTVIMNWKRVSAGHGAMPNCIIRMLPRSYRGYPAESSRKLSTLMITVRMRTRIRSASRVHLAFISRRSHLHSHGIGRPNELRIHKIPLGNEAINEWKNKGQKRYKKSNEK